MYIVKSLLYCAFALVLLLASSENAHTRRKRRANLGPPPTHPVILWSRTLSESKDPEQRKVMAFKLSHYTQPIFQATVVETLLTCAKDPDVQIKVLCTKALGNAKSASQEGQIRELLLSQFAAEPALKNTIVRTLIARKDDSPAVQKALSAALQNTEEVEEIAPLLKYFEEFGSTESGFLDSLVDLYGKRSNVKTRRAIVKVLATRARGQDKVIELLAQCSTERDTPLALNCLSGLQTQAKKDARAWEALQKTIQSDDPDVLLATLDVINALPETKNSLLSTRLLELINEVDDAEIQEKAILALGICGDHSELIVNTLEKVLKKENGEESARIASALTLGRQATGSAEKAKEILSSCSKDSGSQSLKSACLIGLKDIDSTVPTKAPASTPKAP